MQEDCHDYSDDDYGCCLNCEDAEDGCLCYDCKCTKCYYYSKPDDFNVDSEGNMVGSCDIATQTKNESKIKKEFWKLKNKEGCYDYTTLGLKKEQTQLNIFINKK